MDEIVSKQELVDKIIQDEKLHPGDKISYERILELSKKYKITPYTLAVNILGASQSQFNGIRFKGSNAKKFIILKHLIPEMIEKAISCRSKIMQD